MKRKKQNESTITPEQLTANGWKKSKDPAVPWKKRIGRSKDVGVLALIVHRWNGTPMFAISLPDGAIVNINPGSIDELNAFEKMILSYEPNW